MSSNWTYSNSNVWSNSTTVSWGSVYGQQREAPKRKKLEDMTENEVTAAVAEALLKPFICKRCATRVKEVDGGGLCLACTSAWSWASAGTGVYASSPFTFQNTNITSTKFGGYYFGSSTTKTP